MLLRAPRIQITPQQNKLNTLKLMTPPVSLPQPSKAYTYREVIYAAFHVVIMEIILHYHKRFV